MPRWRLHSLRDWPLSLKLATTVLVLAVIPLLLVAWINARAVETHSLSREVQSLQRRSSAAARRLEERVGRLRAYVELVANNPTIVAGLSRMPRLDDGADGVAEAQAFDAQHPEIHALLVSLRRANPWFANVYLLDPDGICIATSERATKPEMIGRPYDYRPYFQAAIEDGAPFVSDVLKNANSPGTGIFVSAPVAIETAQGPTVAGVVVLKVDTGALHEVVADLARTGGSVLLVDRFGVVVSDAWTGTLRDVDDPQSLQFHPFASVARFQTLFEQTRRYGTPDGGEHYLDRVQQPLPLDPLWNALQQRQAGAAEHDFPPSFGAATVPTMVGYAPIVSGSGEPYGYVVLGEPAADFRGPLREIAESALLRFGLVAFGVALVIALLIRRFSRQVVDLAESARRLAEGERASPIASIELDRRDELGVLAGSIQRLSTHVQTSVAAEQQARRDSERARDAAEALAKARIIALTRAHAALEEARAALITAMGSARPGRDASEHDPARVALALEGLALDLAALSESELHLHPGPVAIAPLVQEVLEARRDELPDRPVRMEVEGPQPLPTVHTDRAAVRRIVEHLVDNACKLTRRGHVTVRLGVDPDTEPAEAGAIVLSVVDTGIGLTARQAARITTDAPDLGPIGDGGIGLWVVRRLAVGLGATLHAEGEVGRGSTVTVRLPTDMPVAAPTPAAADVDPAPASS